VGALRRIDRRLLGNSLHCGAGGRNDAAAELADMLKAAGSPAEAAALRAELAQARSPWGSHPVHDWRLPGRPNIVC
jgi:hypothetical protein